MNIQEDIKIYKKMRGMSGTQSIRLFFDLYAAAIEMVRGSLVKGKKRSKKALLLEVGKLSSTIGHI
jgi:hypothetical protein